jgi:WD40 repeat protein
MHTKKQKLLIPAVIVIVFLAAVYFSHSKSRLVQDLRGPKAGVQGVFTYGNKLAVLSGDNEVYAWDWNDLKKWPTVVRLKTTLLCPMATDKIVYVPQDQPDTIVVTDLKGESEIKKIPLRFDSKCNMLIPSADCSFIAVLLMQGEESQLALIGPDLELSEIISITEEDMAVFKIAVSNDGRFIAAAGEKNGGAAIVINTDTREPVFQNHVDGITRFDNVIFSPDGEIVYFGERVRFIYAYKIATGDLLRTYEIPEYPPVPQKKQVISAIDVSPDGRRLAASTEPVQKLYLWNTETGEKTVELGLPGPVVGDIAFSPDSEMIASSVLVRSTISIWKATDTND